MVIDFNGNFIDINPGLCAMFGYTGEELLRLNISLLLPTVTMVKRYEFIIGPRDVQMPATDRFFSKKAPKNIVSK